MPTLYFQQNKQIIDVKIATNRPVNAWEGSVVLPESATVKNIITAGGETEIWQTLPRLKGNEIIFAGGKPNGFVGSGTIFQIVMGRGEHFIEFSPETSIYLNDGLGTKLEASLEHINYELSASAPIKVRVDNNPPQPFTPYVYENKNFFDGKPVAVFSTRDFESGINYYEIRETTSQGTGNWHIAESPYLINSDVKLMEIKAVDAFGNERTAILKTKSFFTLEYTIIAVLALGTLIILYNYIKKRLNKKNNR